MKYLYIELNGYKRLSLNGCEKFAMTITETLQLILGTNGSGKSSLLSELSPLPALHTDFSKQGSKIIKIEHNHRLYTLTSTFSPSQKHSFVRDDVGEMNEGGTVTVQRDLVKHQFGIDADVHDLIQGQEMFTSMSPARRKEWFIRLCDTSYDYAIKVYNKLKERQRDAAGAIKLAKRKLVEESEKLIQSDEEERLHKEAKSLHECLNHLLELRKPVEGDLDNLAVSQGQLDELLMKVARSLDNLLAQGEDDGRTLEVLEEQIAQANEERARCHGLMEKHSTDFRANERKIEALQKAEAQTIESLQVDLQNLTGSLQALQAASLVPGHQVRARVALDAFQTVKAPLLDVFSAIPSNREKQFSQQVLQEQKEKLSQLTVLRANLNEKLQEKIAKRRHMEAHKDKPDLTCPSCNHRFSLNYNESAYEQLVRELAELQARLDTEVAPAIKTVEEYLSQVNEYSQLYRQYQGCVQSWPVLAPYWAYLSDNRVVTDEPSSGLHHLSLIERDLLAQLQMEDQREQVAEKEKLLISLKDVGGADLKTLLVANEEVGRLLTEETMRLQSATSRLSNATAAKTRLISIEALVKRLRADIQTKRNLNKEQIETVRRLEFNNAVRQVQSALATREHVLNTLAMQKGIVEHVGKQIRELEQEEEALSILVKQMSPSEGLIAEGLLGFINNFVHQMNQFIKKIWTYPLVIQPCEVVEGASVDLDYKFPMSVKVASNTVSDVSKGSEGMKEIVNLAYRLIAMKYLGLQDSPLMLDEFAKTFDEAHRSSATTVIKALVEQHSFTQLFLVSHYESSYGALANAEVCVLDGMNITTPKLKGTVNAHVVMR